MKVLICPECHQVFRRAPEMKCLQHPDAELKEADFSQKHTKEGKPIYVFDSKGSLWAKEKL